MIPASGRFPGGGHGNPLQYSCLDNPTDRRAWWNTVHRVAKSQIRLKLLSTQAHVPYISGVTQYLSFYVWLISLSVTSSVFIHVIEGDSNSLLFKVEDIPVYVCTAFCLCIQLLVPPFGCYREWCCCEHGCANTSWIPCFSFLVYIPTSMLKSRDITLPTEVHIIKAKVFPVVHMQLKELEHKEGRAPKN